MSHDNSNPAERKTKRPAAGDGQPKTAGNTKTAGKNPASGRKNPKGKEPDLSGGTFRGREPGSGGGAFREKEPGSGSGTSRGKEPGSGGGAFREKEPGSGSGTSRGKEPGAGGGTLRGKEPGSGGGTLRGKEPGSGGESSQGKRTGSSRSSPGKRTGSGSRSSPGKRTGTGSRSSPGKRAGSGSRSSRKRRTGSGSGFLRGKKAGAGRKAPGNNTSEEARRINTKEKGNIRNEDSLDRMNRRDEERARRRAERERKVRRQKIIMAVSSCIILFSVIGIAVFCLPSVKLSFRLFLGGRYSAKEDYVKAQEAYEKALAIDPASVKAYRGLADILGRQGMASEEEQILYTGWEQTQDENLLHYHCVVVLNQAVAEINSGNCTLATADKCVRALEEGKEDAKALELLDVCYERLFKVTEEDDTCMMFFDEDTEQDTCGYTEYEQLLGRMQAVYQARPSEEAKQMVKRYAVIDMPHVRISLTHLESYLALLTEINQALHDADIAETMACLTRAKEVRDYFGAAFDEFGAGNYAYARELVSDESYQEIRDAFIEENSGYWEGSLYIPVSREQLVLHREEGKARFSFLGSEEYGNHRGVITVWGTKQEDDGVQRSAISYEPAAEPGADSHIEYTVQYLYSNVKIDGKYVPQMNYRFDTKTTTSEGVTTKAIGDWGGEHEWEIDY